MKKVFKLGCLGFIGLLVLGFIIGLFSGEEESVSTGSNNSKEVVKQETEETEMKEVETDSKLIDATSQTQTINGLVIGLGEIKVEKDRIQVGINIENTSSQSIMFYPDQGSAVIGNMQVDANLFFTEGDISGDIISGVQKEGVIEFLAPEGKEIDIETLTEIKLFFGDVVTEDFMNSDPANFVITVE